MLVNMVRTIHAVQSPSGYLHLAYQVSAGHWCVSYTLIAICASGVLLTVTRLASHHPQRTGRGLGVKHYPGWLQ